MARYFISKNDTLVEFWVSVCHFNKIPVEFKIAKNVTAWRKFKTLHLSLHFTSVGLRLSTERCLRVGVCDYFQLCVVTPLLKRASGSICTMRWSITSGLAATSSANISARFYLGLPRSRDRIGNESVPIQLAQCRFFGLAISDAKILTDFFSNKIYRSNFIKQHSETFMVWNNQDADCGLKMNLLCYLIYCRPIFVPCWQSNWMRVIRE